MGRTERRKEDEREKQCGDKEREIIEILYINISGINKEKAREIEEIMKNKKNTLVLMTETHMKWDELEIDKSLEKIIKMREINDKKGGGLMIMYKRAEFNDIIRSENKNSDILTVMCTWEHRMFFMYH